MEPNGVGQRFLLAYRRAGLELSCEVTGHWKESTLKEEIPVRWWKSRKDHLFALLWVHWLRGHWFAVMETEREHLGQYSWRQDDRWLQSHVVRVWPNLPDDRGVQMSWIEIGVADDPDRKLVLKKLLNSVNCLETYIVYCHATAGCGTTSWIGSEIDQTGMAR